MNETSTRAARPTANLAVVTVVLLLGVAAYVAAFTYAMRHTTYDVWGALLIAPILIALSVPILLRFARSDPVPHIKAILITALVLKLCAAVARYYVAFDLYEGLTDAAGYSANGARLADDFRQFDFDELSVDDDASIVGTRFLTIVTGFIYAVTGPSLIGGYLVFSWLGFWGLFFFYRAFRVGVQDGDAKRYALLLFFLPSLLFWPSGIGKEAWMMLALGMSAYGSALLLGRRRGAIIYLTLGLAALVAVRPHVAMLIFSGLVLAYILRGRGAQRVVALGRLRTLLGLAALGVASLLVIRQVANFIGVEELNVDTATQALDDAQRNTSQGGAEFAGPAPSLRNIPVSLVTVLFRPFVFEAHNLQALLTAIEGTLLLTIFIVSLPRLRTIPRRLRMQPYVTLCIAYTLAFCFVFSSFQNFAILARERVMVYPFVLVLLALSTTAERARHASDDRSEPRGAAASVGYVRAPTRA